MLFWFVRLTLDYIYRPIIHDLKLAVIFLTPLLNSSTRE